MNKEATLAISAIIVLVGILLLSSMTMLTLNASSANISNSSTIAKVYVWNTEPNITRIVITPSPSIDLTAGNTTQVNCTAYIFDYNGWADVNITNATFYNYNYSNSSGPDDNNNHYTNDSCACEAEGSGGYNATCTCTFIVEYYAAPGTWICNITIQDNWGNATERGFNFNLSRNESTTINSVLGIETVPEIDYGNLSVTEISDWIPANVTNIGNVKINISVRAYAGQNISALNATDFAMFCERGGNITLPHERFTLINGIDYSNMTNITSSTTQIVNFTLPVRSNDSNIYYGQDRNTTYWVLQVPLSVGGYCNGTVEFAAIDAS